MPRPARGGAIVSFVVPSQLIAPLALVAAIASPASSTPKIHVPLGARQLWATIDVCNPPDQPSTLGIRGSMPADGHPKDTLYMRFRVQYLDPATKAWAYVSRGADSGFLKLGHGNLAWQGGHNFKFVKSGSSAFTLRGYVVFQWRRGSTVLESVARTTTAGHRSLAGADPPGYSAATCRLSA